MTKSMLLLSSLALLKKKKTKPWVLFRAVFTLVGFLWLNQTLTWFEQLQNPNPDPESRLIASTLWSKLNKAAAAPPFITWSTPTQLEPMAHEQQFSQSTGETNTWAVTEKQIWRLLCSEPAVGERSWNGFRKNFRGFLGVFGHLKFS